MISRFTTGQVLARLEEGGKVLGIHLRGSDKSPSTREKHAPTDNRFRVEPQVLPLVYDSFSGVSPSLKEYLPYAEQFLKAHPGSVIYVATDTNSYASVVCSSCWMVCCCLTDHALDSDLACHGFLKAYCAQHYSLPCWTTTFLSQAFSRSKSLGSD